MAFPDAIGPANQQTGALAGAAASRDAQRRTLFSPQELLSNFFRDRWWVLVGFTVPVVLASLLALRVTPTWTAESRLLLLPSQDYIFRSEIGEAGTGTALDRTQIVAAEMEILRSFDLRRRLLTREGVPPIYPDMPADALVPAAQRLGAGLNVVSVAESSSIRVEFRHAERTLAAPVLNLLIDAYLDKRREVFTAPQTAFVKEQAEEFAARLSAAEAQLADFLRAQGVADVADQIKLLLRRHGEALEARDQLDQVIAERDAHFVAIERRLASTPVEVDQFVDVSDRPDVEAARANLLNLEIRRQDLLTRFTETSVFVRDIDAQIRELQQLITRGAGRRQETRHRARNAVFDELDRRRITLRSELDGARAQRAQVDQTAREVIVQVERLVQVGAEAEALRRERDILDEGYQFYARKLSQLEEGAEIEARKDGNVRVVQPAIMPTRANDNRGLILFGGVIGGMVLGISLSLIRAGLRQSFLTSQELERHMALPVLVVVNDRAAPAKGKRPAPANGQPAKRRA
jgi:uncharacterized protein involved in exopolysaccharide biosynthesis